MQYGGRWSWAVVEDVPEVGVSGARAHLVRPSEGAVRPGDDMTVVDRSDEARPAGPRLELVGRAEERLAGRDVDVDPGSMVIQKSFRKGGSVASFCVTSNWIG